MMTSPHWVIHLDIVLEYVDQQQAQNAKPVATQKLAINQIKKFRSLNNISKKKRHRNHFLILQLERKITAVNTFATFTKSSMACFPCWKASSSFFLPWKSRQRHKSKTLAMQLQGHFQNFFVNGHKTATKDREQQSLYKLESEQTSVRRSSASRFVVDCQG